MWQSRIWHTPSLERSSRTAGSALRRGRAAGLAAVLCVLLCLQGVPAVGAASPITVTRRQQSYVFSTSLTFDLQANAGSRITDVVLFYGQQGVPLVRRIYPSFTPGTQIVVKHIEKLEAGQYSPGTILRTWWQISTEDGGVLTTDEATLVYNDDKQNWKQIHGAQVDYYWYGQDEAKAKDLAKRADDAIAHLATDTGVTLSKRVRIYAYNSQNDMRIALAKRSTGYDEQIMTLGQASGQDVLLLLATHRDVNQTIAHELSHIVVGIATDNPYTDLPNWLNEGLAMYAEGKLPSGNQSALEAGIRADTLLSIRSMSSYTGQASQVDLFYGEAYSIVDYMLKTYGRDKMQRLLGVFAEGTLQEEALQRAYGLGLDDLDNGWRASLGLKPRSGAASGATSRATSAAEVVPGAAGQATIEMGVTPAASPTPRRSATSSCSYGAGLILPLLGGALVLGLRTRPGVA
jgi:hypothetical protein